MNEFIELIGEINPEAVTVDGFDDCVIGMASRFGSDQVLAYSVEKMIAQLSQDMEESDAWEYFYFNILGAWWGPGTPVYIEQSV